MKRAPHRHHENLWKEFNDSFAKDSAQAIFMKAECLDHMWNVSMQSPEFMARYVQFE